MDGALFIFFVGLSIFLIVSNVVRRIDDYRGSMDEDESKYFKSPIMRLVFTPCAYAGAWLGTFSFIKNNRRLKRRIVAAGLDCNLDASTFIVFQFVIVCLSVFFLTLILPFSFHVNAVVGAAAGILYSELWLIARASSRRRALERDLPGMLDMLTLSVEAVLVFEKALRRVTNKARKGALKDELLRADAAMKIGASRREALCNMSERVCVPAFKSLVSLLVQAERMGTSIGPVLRSASARLRSERFADAEQRGVKASQKMTFPLVLFIMPTTFIVVFGPLVVRYFTGGLEALMG